MNHAISRRTFSKLIGVTAASAAVGSLPIVDFSARTTAAPAIVRLSSNENPYGPAPDALKAMTEAFSLAWRYPDEYADLLTGDLAKLNSVPAEQILLGDGSGEILKLCAVAFTGKDKKVVVANPTFESIARHASVANAEVVKIDLTSDFDTTWIKCSLQLATPVLFISAIQITQLPASLPRVRYHSFSRRYHAQRQCSSTRHITIMLTLKTTRV